MNFVIVVVVDVFIHVYIYIFMLNSYNGIYLGIGNIAISLVCYKPKTTSCHI